MKQPKHRKKVLPKRLKNKYNYPGQALYQETFPPLSAVVSAAFANCNNNGNSNNNNAAGEMSFDDVRCAYASWKGGVSHYDSYNVVKSMDKLFDELFIHPFIGGGHRDEQNNNEQK